MSRTRRIARRLPSVPGYRYARRKLLPRVRSSSTARAVAKRIFELDVASGRMSDLAPGTLLAGMGAENLPVVAVLALRTRADALEDLVADVARQQLVSASFRPVFVLSATDLSAPRRYGYVTELLVTREAWPHHDHSWDDYARDRVASILARYAAVVTLHPGPDGLTEVDRLVLEAVESPAI